MLLGDILKEQAEHRPHRIALIFGDCTHAYGSLNATVNQLAHGLIDAGVRKGDRVAVLGRNSDSYIGIYFALAKIGVIMVPVNFWFKADEIRYVIEQSQSFVFIVESRFCEVVQSLVHSSPVNQWFWYGDERSSSVEPPGQGSLLDAIADNQSAEEPVCPLDPDDPHIILYTSGTTGFPKGAVLSHRNHAIHATSLAQTTDQRDEDRAPVIYPLFHTGGTDCVVLPHFLHGGTCIILDGGDPGAILEAVQRHQLTSIFCVPTLWRRILRTLAVQSFDVSSIRRCLGSSDTFPPPLLNEILDRFPSADFYQTYGLTEAGCILTVCKLTRHDRSRIDSVGKPMPIVDVRIVDHENRELPRGEVGEIVASGETIMKEYWNQPKQTADAFQPITKFSDSENQNVSRRPWLHSGDLAFQDDDGYVYIAGRKKDVIISGGENIYPVEVERVIKQNPNVRDCAVIGVPDPEWGESVLAVIVRQEASSISESEIIEFVRERVAGFKKPRYVEFVDELPVTSATGKMQRAELRRLFAERGQQSS